MGPIIGRLRQQLDKPRLLIGHATVPVELLTDAVAEIERLTESRCDLICWKQSEEGVVYRDGGVNAEALAPPPEMQHTCYEMTIPREKPMKLVPGYWCQELQFGWLPGSPTACTVPGHHHVQSDRNPLQPEHAVIADWQRK